MSAAIPHLLGGALGDVFSGVLSGVLAVWVALAVDRAWGEPRARWHPVVWMGRYLGGMGALVQRQALQQPGQADWPAFWRAAAAWCLGAAVVAAAAWALQTAVLMLPWWGAGLLLGVLLKPLLAWALLRREVEAVEAALGQSLDAGRERLRWLVSRDVAPLSDTQVRESTIETLAENLNDSVVAPLFWFALLGLPGAALYRFANTADAMWGYPGLYQGRNWAWAGKWAARADDVLSWVPARLTALLLLLAAGLRGLARARQLPAQARQTPSPNSGWPMAAMALVLGVRLSKPGVYALHAQGRAPQALDTARAVRLGGRALLLGTLLLSLLSTVWAFRALGALGAMGTLGGLSP
ncbi:adenosylcobinamide-phosphate synthase CbiB [Hylemonella gracilis]|uniref:Cobalamin biosynthesis protein CobD n=1 Tax=Hylemonella gracilis ATCC 19624 TaxID=887062 RepID=F3KV41_9BURK|nr:adenosylcobinamide-phosphate synthase CbiB [Hylemonella gracilis]EGI76345.1 adenosylcobinamide-phosphate synthase [Hylemonella gracilis ATCC 19624]